MDDPSRLIELIRSYTLSTHTEKDLQSDIEIVFKTTGVEHVRECALTKSDVVDFLVGGVGVECKIKGSKAEVIRQLSRYSMSSRVRELLLLTTKASHKALDGITLQGKAVRVFWINNL